MRRLEEFLAHAVMLAACLLTLGTIFAIVGTIVWKGLPALSVEMITRPPSGGYYLGGGGGILNAIVGSLWIGCGATGLALAVGLPVALCLRTYGGGRRRWVGAVRLAMDVLWGVPSIVYGAFGFALMVAMGIRASLLGGMITVALLILPAMVRAIDEVMRMVPRELWEASVCLGATKIQTAVRVVVRQVFPGILGAVLLSFGRGIGDAASVLFTAGFSDRVPTSLMEPAATLPLAIFFQLGTPFPEVQARAYASALVLTTSILAVSLAARALARRGAKFGVR